MQSAAPKFFRSGADFPTFRGRKEFGCRPARAKRVAGAGRRARMRIDGGDRRGQKKVARCGEGGLRTVGGGGMSGPLLPRFGCAGCSVRCFWLQPGFRVPANVSGPGGTLRATQRVIWKSCPHALSLRPEPFVEPCIAERDISTTVGGASLRVPSGSMSTGSAASSD